VTTSGLRYALAGATLDRGPTLGLSNELVSPEATVTVGDGALIVTTHRAYH
jgi:thiamine pyrophosphokinase